VLRAPELDAGLPGRSHQSGAAGQNPLPRPAGHAAGDAAQVQLAFWAAGTPFSGLGYDMRLQYSAASTAFFRSL